MDPDAGAPTPRSARAEPMSIEVFIGRRVAPLVGALAVLLAVGFLVKYAVDIGFFGRLAPLTRFGLGIGIGVVLLVAGEFVRRRGARDAAVGLDAAGIGSLLVSAVIAVYWLDLFGKGAGALVACGAGLFGVFWSLRTQSVVVGAVALLALFGVPVGFDQFRESALVSGLQVTLAVLSGCAMQAAGPARFEALRALSVALGFFLGGVTVATTGSGALSCAFVGVWWAAFAAGATLNAIRGRARRMNAVVVLLTSLAVLAAYLPTWIFGSVFGLGALSNPVAWLALGVGAALAAQSMLLRTFDVSEGASAGESEPENAEGLATSRACSSLASFAEPLAAVLSLSALSVFVDERAVAPVWAAGAGLCAWIASRRRTRASALGLEIVAPIAVLPSLLASLRSMRLGAPGADVSVPLPWDHALELHATPAIGLVAALAVLLFAAPAARLRAIPAISACVLAASLSIAAAVAGATTSAGFLLLLSLAPLATGAWRTAPPQTAWAGVALALLTAIGIGLRAMYALAAGAGDTDLGDAIVLGLAAVATATGLELAAARPDLDTLRPHVRTLVRVSAHVVASMLLVATNAVGARVGGVEAANLGLVLVLACAAVSLLFQAAALVLRRLEIALAGWALGALGVLGGTLAGLSVLFTRAASEDARAQSQGLGAATAIAVLAVLGAALAAMRALGVQARIASATQAIAGVALVPVGALLVASVVGVRLAAPLAAGWIIAVGVAELVIGFRRNVPPLRWAGLVAFTLLVLRLYAVDLAGTPLPVRIALLFLSGVVLVVTGIVYARGVGAAGREGGKSGS